MKKKILMACSIVLIISLIFIMEIINWNPLTKINYEEIDTVTFHNPVQYYEVTEIEYIKLLVDLVQSMKLHRTINIAQKTGCPYEIELNMKNGEDFVIAILSKDVSINRDTYKSDKDYSQQLIKLFEDLSDDYEIKSY